jgi:hypothetical protein
MTTTRCIHGLDSRFCAVCNRSKRGTPSTSAAASDTSLAEILRFLNDTRIRATDGAVAGAIGIPAQLISTALGARRSEASWVVNGDTGLPTGYEQVEWHPDLLAASDVIRTVQELTLRLALWRARVRPA